MGINNYPFYSSRLFERDPLLSIQAKPFSHEIFSVWVVHLCPCILSLCSAGRKLDWTHETFDRKEAVSLVISNDCQFRQPLLIIPKDELGSVLIASIIRRYKACWHFMKITRYWSAFSTIILSDIESIKTCNKLLTLLCRSLLEHKLSLKFTLGFQCVYKK